MPSGPSRPEQGHSTEEDLIKTTRAVRIQFGALPYRLTKAGALEILLVTSRHTRRWIIPKGWPIKGKKPSQSAAREAYEEAGVRGIVAVKAIGSFSYEKWVDDKWGTIPCEVRVFPLLVRRHLKRWPEANERELRWLDPLDAASLVEEEGLRELICSFATRKNGRTSSIDARS
jgi:8-oxo-dGTP pyrophosphatase MutT (NUDIX family)